LHHQQFHLLGIINKYSDLPAHHQQALHFTVLPISFAPLAHHQQANHFATITVAHLVSLTKFAQLSESSSSLLFTKHHLAACSHQHLLPTSIINKFASPASANALYLLLFISFCQVYTVRNT
jgi:hypothetical protein